MESSNSFSPPHIVGVIWGTRFCISGIKVWYVLVVGYVRVKNAVGFGWMGIQWHGYFWGSFSEQVFDMGGMCVTCVDGDDEGSELYVCPPTRLQRRKRQGC